MPTYAIVESGGKQYRVEQGQSLLVDRISEDEGAKIGLRALMFRTDDDTVLEPKELEKVKVEAKIAGHERGEKIRVFKYKAKKGYRKRHGHRSELTRLEVTELKMLTRKPAKSAEQPGTSEEAASKPKAAPKPKPAAKAKATEKKPAAKKPAATTKPAAATKTPAAKKPAAKRKPAAKKESD